MLNEIVIRQALSEEDKADIATRVLSGLRAVLVEDLKDRLLSPAETCKMFQPSISKMTLHTWTKEGRIKSYTIGRNVFYRYSEVLESAKELKRYRR